MSETSRRRSFTLIEVLAVIGIIVLVMSMALPALSAMMKAKKWNAAVANIQAMVTRARALATGNRIDFSVEFRVLDNGTTMWLESEVNDIERVPDLVVLQEEIGGGTGLRDFMERFYQSGGRYKYGLTKCICTSCGKRWQFKPGGGSTAPCPKCGVNTWRFPPITETHYYDIDYDPDLAIDTSYADNARQSEVQELAPAVMIDLKKCRNFYSWDSKESVEAYGYDELPDVRIGTNGALVQTREPVIALRYGLREGEYEWRGTRVIRCTGRLIPESLKEESLEQESLKEE
jgi:hypothetical protein